MQTLQVAPQCGGRRCIDRLRARCSRDLAYRDPHRVLGMRYQHYGSVQAYPGSSCALPPVLQEQALNRVSFDRHCSYDRPLLLCDGVDFSTCSQARASGCNGGR